MAWLMLVSGAPVYVFYLLVRLYPALVALRVGFTYVHCNTITGGVMSTITFHLPTVSLRCSLYHWSLFRKFSVGLCGHSRFLLHVFLCLSSLLVLCYVSLVLDICCVLYMGSYFSVLQCGLLRSINQAIHRPTTHYDPQR